MLPHIPLQFRRTGKKPRSFAVRSAVRSWTFTVEAVAEDSAETVRDTEREKEYAEIGITVSQNGTWLYEGEEISFLLDEDQGVYNNDTDGEEALYVYVSRTADGKVEKAQVVDGGELIERMAELDSKE